MAGFLENLRTGNVLGLVNNAWEGLRDEWLGVDDFTRVFKKIGEGDFLGAAKSLGAGVAELGGTALMVVPGGQVAALAAKGGKAGKLGKALNLARPMSLEEQAAQRLALRGGAQRRLLGGPKLDDISQMVGRTLGPLPQQPAGGLLSRVGQTRLGQLPIGAGRGGVGGSLLRGVGQATGTLPMSQGPLARNRFTRPLSGMATPIAARVGFQDPLGLLTPIGSRGQAPVSQVPPVDPQMLALFLQMYGYGGQPDVQQMIYGQLPTQGLL